MGKHQEERKTPVIMVKKRRTFSEPSLSEKTDIIAPVFTEQTTESVSAGINSSAVEKHIPEAPARKKKKKNGDKLMRETNLHGKFFHIYHPET